MPRTPIPTLRKLLSYDPETGDVTWKVDRHGGQGNKPIKAGSIAGSIYKTGYRYININRSPQLAHRIAWALTHGRWPKHQIDHCNMDRSDNRLRNLREATNRENTYNRSHQQNNSSKIKGISKTGSGYFARIKADGKQYYLGHFKTAKEAKEAYDNAAKSLHKVFFRS